MARFCLVAALFIMLTGCGEQAARMQQAEDPHGRYRDQITVAKRLLEQNENWAARAEWEVVESSDGWRITAWRIEHPDAKGAARYLPWGYSVVDVNRRMVAVHYTRKG